MPLKFQQPTTKILVDVIDMRLRLSCGTRYLFVATILSAAKDLGQRKQPEIV